MLGKYLLALAAIINLASAKGLITPDGVINFVDIQKDEEFGLAVEALVKTFGVVVPVKADQIIQYLVAQTTAIEILLK